MHNHGYKEPSAVRVVPGPGGGAGTYIATAQQLVYFLHLKHLKFIMAQGHEARAMLEHFVMRNGKQNTF